MIFALGIIVFVVLLTLSVVLHEIGHTAPAKWFNVYVSKFFVGFGPTLWSRKRGETEYGIKAFPLGGFMKMAGMYPPEGTGRKAKAAWRARLEADAREASRAEIAEAGDARSFYRLSAPRKAIIMLGGPTMNLIVCFLLIAVVYCGIGSMGPSLALGKVTACLDGTGAAVTCETEGAIPSPAAEAGLKAGDRITEWNGHSLSTWDDLVLAIQSDVTIPPPATDSNGGSDSTAPIPASPATLSVVRDGQAQSVTLTPLILPATQTTPARAIIGVIAGQERIRGSFGDVPGIVWGQVKASAAIYARLPVLVWDAAVDTVAGKERAADSPVSVVGVARITGELSEDAADYVDAGDVWASRWSMWLSIAASFNLALWMFNLVPLLPLDGGHILGAVIEGTRRTWARLRGRPRDQLPGAFDLVRAIPITYVVFVLLILMTLVLVAADLINPVSLG